jgi:hypothetical protein
LPFRPNCDLSLPGPPSPQTEKEGDGRALLLTGGSATAVL